MAFSSLGSGSGVGRGRFRGHSTLSEMNIVPLVDVVLVLLIIFMITAQAMQFGLDIEVPKVKQERVSAEDLPVVSVTRAGEVYLAEKPVNINELGERIRSEYGKKGNAAYLVADTNTNWGAAVQVVDALGRAGIAVRVVTTTQEDNPRKGR